MHAYVRHVSAFNPSDITDSIHFKRWFGESKVVTGDGAARIVYHGTDADVRVFRPRKRDAVLGFHFGSLSQAELFAGCNAEIHTMRGGNIMPVYLRIENPLRMPDIFGRGRRGAEGIEIWLYRNGIVDPVGTRNFCRAKTASQAYQCLATAIEMAGYDGIVYENENEGGTATTNEDSYIAFRSAQIKSIFNRGSFDPENPDILA
jgi:hypothetical protein